VHPDLGLNGLVTWLTDTKIRVEYDWSADSQLLDWTSTKNSNLIRGNNTLTLNDGAASVISMKWKQLIQCTRIYAENAKAVNSASAHLNFITNALGWTGFNFNTPEILGVVYNGNGNLWLENGSTSASDGAPITLGSIYSIDINISDSVITSQSSSDNILYTHNLAAPPDKNREVVIGGWGGDTEWGKVIIEGEISLPLPVPPDMIQIQSIDSIFAPVIEVTGNPVIEWVFDDSTTSSSALPVKNYGSTGYRNNYLKVTPWSSLIGINVGYDAGDEGYGGFAMVAPQNVTKIKNLAVAKESLQYICISYNPITDLDIRELTQLKFVEALFCPNLKFVKMGIHPVMERLCFENCSLDSLDLSGCIALKDLRASTNNYKRINWGSTGDSLWHLCVRTNPQLNENLPDLARFTSLRELLTWDDNQTGAFVCHNPGIQRIDSYDNLYTSADISGCVSLKQFSLSGSKLDSIQLGTAYSLMYLRLKDCGLNETQTDYVLRTLDLANRTEGYLEIDVNEPPSVAGLVHFESLKAKRWTIHITKVSVTTINISGSGVGGAGDNLIAEDNGTLQLTAEILPANATYKSVTWSVINETGLAIIDTLGKVTALDDGTVSAMAMANDSSGISDTYLITISNQNDTGTVVNNITEEQLKIIVNQNEIRIILNDSYIGWNAYIFNLNGIILLSKIIDNDEVVFDTSSLISGLYIVILSKAEQIKTAKISLTRTK